MKTELEYEPLTTDRSCLDFLVREKDHQKYWAKKTARLKKHLGYEIEEQVIDLGDLGQRDPENAIASLLTTTRPDVFSRRGKVLEIAGENMALAKYLPLTTIYVGLRPKTSDYHRRHEQELRGGAQVLLFDWDFSPPPLPFPAESFDLVLSRHLILGKSVLAAEIARLLKPEGRFILKGTAHLLTKPETESLSKYFKILELWHISYQTAFYPVLGKTSMTWRRYFVYALGEKISKKDSS